MFKSQGKYDFSDLQTISTDKNALLRNAQKQIDC